MTPIEDPGWRHATRGLFVMFVPTRGARMAMSSGNSLILLRQVWVSFASAMTLIWIPVALVWGSAGPGAGFEGKTVAALVVGAGVFAQLLAVKIVPAVSGRTEEATRAVVQRAFFLRLALAEVGALVGFVGFVLSANPMVYLAGYVVGAIGLFDAAPTAAKIARMQQELRESGSDVDLLAALVSGGLTR